MNNHIRVVVTAWLAGDDEGPSTLTGVADRGISEGDLLPSVIGNAVVEAMDSLLEKLELPKSKKGRYVILDQGSDAWILKRMSDMTTESLVFEIYAKGERYQMRALADKLNTEAVKP